MSKKQDLKSLTRKDLISWFKENNIQRFRAEQTFNWIYKNYISDFQEMANLPQKLRTRLKTISYITDLSLKDRLKADDGTIKYLWELIDGYTIESVFIPYPSGKRYSVCISTQVGCAMGCKFCATGMMGLDRSLKAGEIVDQVLKMEKDVEKNISNVVFMGMGEPLDNIDNLISAIKILNSDQGMNIGARKMTVSTAGVVPGIKRLANWEKQIGLAISLNASNDKLRNKIMPINKKYPLKVLLEAVKNYINKKNRRVTFEYVLIKDINDSEKYARQLGNLLANILCHVNLIPVNPVPDLNIERPSQHITEKFKKTLSDSGVNVTVRKERGSTIQAACGQLRYIEDKRGN